MSHPSPNSSSANGPPSSPFDGTNPTVYSPDVERKPNHRRQLTAIPIGKQAAKKFLPEPPAYVEGAFVDELDEFNNTFVSRYLYVEGGHDAEHLKFLVQNQMKRYDCFKHSAIFLQDPHAAIFIRFDSLSDAIEARDLLIQAGFATHYATMDDLARSMPKDIRDIQPFEGQMFLSMFIDANPEHAVWEFTAEDYEDIKHQVDLIAREFGIVRNVVHVDTVHDEMRLIFRIEFDSIDAAQRAIQSLRRTPVYGFGADRSYFWSTINVGDWVDERPLGSHRFQHRGDTRRPYRGQFRNEDPQDEHNRVRRERILDGSDVRTTVMLRNIPANCDWMTLKNILDQICFGTYDFVYLRIDFKKCANVGYAFINFTDVGGMLMLLEMEFRYWPGFISDKKFGISYATIQGREALVQKFRNSSVMQETPYCRPRLFITQDEAELMNSIRHAGTELPLPRPDNISKLQRSIDSARSTGLFAPRAYSSGTEYRHHFSTFDRGSPRDNYQTAMHHAQQHAAPLQFAGLTEAQKQKIEAWYLHVFGGGHRGPIPFDSIPMTHIQLYFEEHPHLAPIRLTMARSSGSGNGTPRRSGRGSDSDNWRGGSSGPSQGNRKRWM
ncbi:uncharacterized protein J4E79_008711 [Alternaria viburni]|uniref:uncharacterized protein n=1 Tax=Alternaria viburni TaxID=566460 RepID=UPI0020C41D5F|nr:uncharacterized protein J4E79_008711 [Alternaria viburni]KAI4653198.1 hypothetical protein J4E79_008711 [Alternaria viburni]